MGITYTRKNGPRVAIIGRSGSGKSALIDRLKNQVDLKIISEVAREVLHYHPDDSPEMKQLLMLNKQTLREDWYESFISDRGLHDYVTYSSLFPNLSEAVKIHYPILKYRYTHVFKVPNRPFNPEGRVEKDEEEAENLQKRVELLYALTGHRLIHIPEDTLENKAKYVINSIKGYK